MGLLVSVPSQSEGGPESEIFGTPLFVYCSESGVLIFLFKGLSE